MRRSNAKVLAFYIMGGLCALLYVVLFGKTINNITIASLILLFVSIISLRWLMGSFFRFEIVFLLLSYIFHCSHAVIILFNFFNNFAYRSVVVLRGGIDVFIAANTYVAFCHFFLALGFLLTYKQGAVIKAPRVDKRCQANIIVESRMSANADEIGTVRLTGWIIFILTAGFMIYRDSSMISALRMSGYESTYSSVSKFAITVSALCRPSMLLLIIGYSNNRKVARTLFVVFGAYLIWAMSSGDRGTNVLIIITMVFLYFNIVERLRLKYMVIGIIGIYAMLLYINTIAVYRSSSAISFEIFWEIITLKSGDNMLIYNMHEFGVTMQPVCCSLMYFPSYSGYNYGLTYILSMFGIFPYLPSSLATILKTSFSYVYAFPAGLQSNMGGSYLGELFFNFGWLGTVLCLFVGIIIGKLSNRFHGAMTSKSQLQLARIAVVLPPLLLWVRGYFVDMLFTAFWLNIALSFFVRIKKTKTLVSNNFGRESGVR